MKNNDRVTYEVTFNDGNIYLNGIKVTPEQFQEIIWLEPNELKCLYGEKLVPNLENYNDK